MGDGAGMSGAAHRTLVAGMGNLLHGDDGFGVAVAQALAARPLDPAVRLIEVGIGGMHLVQELMEGYGGLVILDAVHRGAEPGTVFLLRPEVPDLRDLPLEERRAQLADMHYTVPSRALLMARALDVLPAHVWIVGCEPEACELGIGLSKPVEDAVEEAAHLVERLIARLRAGGSPAAEKATAADRLGRAEELQAEPSRATEARSGGTVPP